jgi:hypothetical protein
MIEMKFDNEPFRAMLAWTIAFSILEPVVTAINFVFFRSTMVPIYDVYPGSSPFLVATCEYLYYTALFVKTMYVYKYILKRDTYVPPKGDMREYVAFVACYLIIQLLADVVYASIAANVKGRISFLKFLRNYTREVGVFAILRTQAFAIAMLVVTENVYFRMDDLVAIGMLLTGVFVVTVASF